MTKFAKAVGVAGILVAALVTDTSASLAAQPEKAVAEGQAAVTLLDENTSAVTYWVNESDGWHVITTVETLYGRDSYPMNHAVVRFASLLLPGQTQQISIPSDIGEQQQMLRISRLDEGIEVTRISSAPAY